MHSQRSNDRERSYAARLSSRDRSNGHLDPPISEHGSGKLDTGAREKFNDEGKRKG